MKLRKKRYDHWVLPICMLLALFYLFYAITDKPAPEGTEYSLYAMDYKYKDHHKQFYIVATDGGLAQEVARESGCEITSMRKIDVPILVVR